MGRGRPKKVKNEEIIPKENNDDEKDFEEQITSTSKPPKQISEKYDITTTGIDILDLIGGGFLWGKMINFVGDKSTGKTLLASEFIFALHKIYGNNLKWFYDDAEAGYSFDSKAMYNLDIVAEDEQCSDTIEDFMSNVEKQIKKLKDNERLIYILDSFDGLTSDEELNHWDETMKAREKGKEGPGTYGQAKSKGSSMFFRVMKRKIKDKKVILIILSQIRDKFNVTFGQRWTRTGGHALDFYASQIFLLAEAEKHEKLGLSTGITVKIKNMKNKVSPPFREGFVEIIFDHGVDNVTSNLMYLYGLKTDLGKNKDGINTKKLMWDGVEYSLRQLVRHIEKNNFEEELKGRCRDLWRLTEEKASAATGRKPKF